jgi:hypothetical protein
MPTRTLTDVATDDAVSAVSWKAIIAGAIGIVAVTFILLVFGVGVGFAVISPWADQGVSATTFTITGALYLIAVAMLASTIGGYLAGRLRSQWSSVHEHERYFRDSAHGFLAWALAFVVSAAVLGGAFSHIASGASSGLAPAAAAAAQGSSTDGYIDTLLRADPTGVPAEQTNQATSPTAQDQQTATPLQGGQIAGNAAPRASANGVNRAEISRLLVPVLRKGGTLSSDDRIYLGKIVSARTGLSPTDAQARVDQVVTQAKSAADAARKTAAVVSLWLVVSLLAGALSASLAAIEGGNLRNREWYLTDRTDRRSLGIAAE